MATRIVWFRDDLRVRDHEPLTRACQAVTSCAGDGVLPLFVLDPRSFHSTSFGFDRCGTHRQRFLLESLSELDRQLRRLGNRLRVAVGRAEAVLPVLCRLTQAEALYFYRKPAPEERSIEDRVTEGLASLGVARHPSTSGSLFAPEDLPFPLHETPEVFSEFRRRVEKRASIAEPLGEPSSVPAVDDRLLDGKPLVEIETIEPMRAESVSARPSGSIWFQGGESAGWQRINEYFWETDRLSVYKQTRNGMLEANDSSKLAPWLALGCLSARQVHWEVLRYERARTKNDSTYWLRFELLWREFFQLVVRKHGGRVFQRGGIRRSRFPWKRDWQLFEKWRMGMTGFPLIDANMRELAATGYMSNRGRQNVACFLTKNLGIDWRMGAEWFESMLLDFDPCSNYGNWNYVAGIGNDSREFRWFNPIKQAQDYDPEGSYVRHWLPELRGVPTPLVHTPWRMSIQEQQQSRCRVGSDYPEPIVDLFGSMKHNQRLDEELNSRSKSTLAAERKPIQPLLW